MNTYYDIFSDATDVLTAKNDRENQVDESGTDIFNFSYTGKIEFESPLVYGVIEVEISNGKVYNVHEIETLYILNRENEAIKVFISPYGADESICKFVIFNTDAVRDFIVNAAWVAYQNELDNC